MTNDPTKAAFDVGSWSVNYAVDNKSPAVVRGEGSEGLQRAVEQIALGSGNVVRFTIYKDERLWPSSDEDRLTPDRYERAPADIELAENP